MTHPVYNVVDNDAKDGFTFEKKIAFINFFSSQFPFMLSIQLFVAALSLSLSLTTTKLFVPTPPTAPIALSFPKQCHVSFVCKHYVFI